MPPLEERSLEISLPDAAAVYFYEACASKIPLIGVCTKHEMKKISYDLTDPSVRRMLRDKGFVIRVRPDIK